MRKICTDYKEADILFSCSEMFNRMSDMRHGKKHNDDGYRGVHIYYQKDNSHFPIEIQFNTATDRKLADILHIVTYKKNYPLEATNIVTKLYSKRKSIDEIKEVIEHVFDSN